MVCCAASGLLLPAFFVAQGQPFFADKGVETLATLLNANASSTAAAAAAAAASTPSAAKAASGGNGNASDSDGGDDDGDGDDDGHDTDDSKTLGMNDVGFRRRSVVPWWRRAELAIAMGCYKEALVAITGTARLSPHATRTRAPNPSLCTVALCR